MKDDMTPKERKKAIAEGRPADRVPSGFNITFHAARLTGVDPQEYMTNTKIHVETDIAVYREYGVEKLGVFFPIPMLYGTKSVQPKNGHAYISETVPLEGDDLKRVYVEDPKNDPRLKGIFEYLDGVAEQVGDEISVGLYMEGPFTQAGRIIGIEKLLKKTIRDPEYVYAVLDNLFETQKTLVEAAKGYDVTFGIMDPVSSCAVINEADFKKFSKPYLKKIFDVMTSVAGEKPMLHICGNTRKILHDVVETGAGSFSVDNIMDLEEVKHEIGSEITIIGNVKPTETMLFGTPADVDADLKQCFQKAWDTPAGYIPDFGCGLPMETPKENIDAVFDALRRYGKWPLDPANFS